MTRLPPIALLPVFALLGACTAGKIDFEPDPDPGPDVTEDFTEDCSDGVDNDNDGLVDCDDDECSASPDCPQDVEYAIEMNTYMDYMGLAWGEYLEQYYGQRAVGFGYGSVFVEAVADSGESFTCSGQMFLQGYDGYGASAMRYAPGDCEGCDYRFAFEPDADQGSLIWDQDCPIVAPPATYLGFHLYERYVTSPVNGGGWQEQYRSRRNNSYWGESEYGYYYGVLGQPEQQNVVEWTGRYEQP